MASELICVGAISGVRGLRGEVRLKSFTAQPRGIASYKTLFDETANRSFQLRITGQGKGGLIAHIEGVNDRDAAEALKGIRLYAPRAAFPEPGEEEYYHADLVGLRAELASGKKIGTIKAVHDFGAGAILEIDGLKSLMIPFTRQAAPLVDLVKGHIVIDPPLELDSIDDDKEEDKG